MFKPATTYTIRPTAYRGHFEVGFARQDGSHGYTGSADGFRAAVELAREFATSTDRIIARKSRYVGRNAGAWHRLAVA